mgnify:CR=1 FL=1
MKISELRTGDWFNYDNHYWIRTELNGVKYNLNMDDDFHFGTLDDIPEDAEVNYISSHEVNLSTERNRSINAVRYAPILEPLFDVKTYDVWVLRYFNEKLHYTIVSTIWEHELGIWKPVEKPNDFVETTSMFRYMIVEG